MINVEAEINKHKNCRERGELERLIKDYKNFALQHANNFTLAGQYNMVAQKLQEICSKLPPPNIKYVSGSAPSVPVKTVILTHEEDAKINAAWEKRAGSTHNGNKH